jgi:hypothetical protein
MMPGTFAACAAGAFACAYLLTAGAVEATAFEAVFFAAFFFECFFTPVVEVAVASFEAGAGAVVEGAVWAKDIAASARVIEKAVMVFIIVVRFPILVFRPLSAALLVRSAFSERF